MRSVKNVLLEGFEEKLVLLEDEKIFKKEKEMWDTGRLGFLYKGKILDDFRTLNEYGIQKDAVLTITYTVLGGAPKRGRADVENPFAEDEKVKTTLNDRALFEEGFHACVRASSMEDFDFEQALNNLTLDDLNKMLAYFKTKATNENKLKFISEFLGDGPALKKIDMRASTALERFKNRVAKGLWDMGLVDGVFSPDGIKQKIQSIYDYKRGEANQMQD